VEKWDNKSVVCEFWGKYEELHASYWDEHDFCIKNYNLEAYYSRWYIIVSKIVEYSASKKFIRKNAHRSLSHENKETTITHNHLWM